MQRELRDLPPEVRRLVHAADSMRDHWAEAAPPGYVTSARQQELWRDLHEACDAVWGRLDEPAPTS
ncbi:hypothetical protein [Acrocarpospora sp. B8E8]|uniref:hypothetical protein n=1 Tax=Acrocarpospora sp. B8E8 TaxID=3153572 RepID=UPI00325F3605